METVEGNKIIAEFMELKFKDQDKIFVRNDRWGNEEFRPFNETDLQYHESWSWLMPVVEKIQKLGYNVYIRMQPPQIKLCFTETIIDDNANSPTVIWDGELEASAIESVYKAVVQFIQYYNSQTPNNE